MGDRQNLPSARVGRSPTVVRMAEVPGGRAPRLRIGVLGPMTVVRDGAVVDVGPGMVRTLLGALAISPAGLTRQDIVEVLWGDEPPATHANLIHVYVSRLRSRLRGGPDEPDPLLRSERGGYRLDLSGAATDFGSFTGALARARRCRGTGDDAAARQCYAAALRLWRGPIGADLDASFAQLPSAIAAELRRVEAAIEYGDLCSAAGQHTEAAEALRPLAPSAPLHEGLHAQLMVALAGMGERAAALEQYESLRRQLRDSLGIDPGTEVQKIHRTILREGDTGPRSRPRVGTADRVVPAPVPTGPPAEPVLASPPGRPGARRRSRVLFTLFAVVALGLTGWTGAGLAAHHQSDEGLVFHAAERRWGWVYGPTLGETPTPEQWAVADVTGLDDGDHNAGFQLRVSDVTAPGPEQGIKVALTGAGWKVEGDQTGDSGGIVVAPAGRLRIAISADNVITMTYDDAPVMTYRISGVYAGRGIMPTVWQSGKGDVRMTRIRSNAIPAR